MKSWYEQRKEKRAKIRKGFTSIEEANAGMTGGAFVCACCGKRTRDTGRGESASGDTCWPCILSQSVDNSHTDENHGGARKGCPKCEANRKDWAKNGVGF